MKICDSKNQENLWRNSCLFFTLFDSVNKSKLFSRTFWQIFFSQIFAVLELFLIKFYSQVAQSQVYIKISHIFHQIYAFF